MSLYAPEDYAPRADEPRTPCGIGATHFALGVL